MRTKAYIPILDEGFEEVINLEKQNVDHDNLDSDFENEKKRFEDIKQKVDISSDEKAREVLDQIENEKMLHEIENSLIAADEDRDSADRCQNRLLDLKSALDDAEDALEWPIL